jgi:malonyl-CoA/methylmalonyl-CoA synthetase
VVTTEKDRVRLPAEAPVWTVLLAVRPTSESEAVLATLLPRYGAARAAAAAGSGAASPAPAAAPAALPASLAERLRAIAGVVPLERYGMTEIGIALSNPLDPARRRPGRVGMPLPTVAARIVADDGADGDGPGELWVRGPSVFAGYLGREEESRASFRGEGWFATGDIAERDGEGSIRLLGRSSTDILKSGGEKISALEIEEALREHASVLDAAVVGVPDPVWGDRVVAFVVPREGAEASAAAIVAFMKTRVAPFKVPKEVRVVASLPRNAMGKVQKKELARELVGS